MTIFRKKTIRSRPGISLRFLLFLFNLAALSILIITCSPPEENAPDQFTVGLITNNANGLRNIQGFQDRMEELGYIDGDSVIYLFSGEPTDANLLEAAIQGFLDQDVDLIFTAGTPTGVAANLVTTGTNTPVVFGVIADPLEAGVLSNLTKPGGNMTGVMLSENQGLRLELLKELAPDINQVLVPYDPGDAASTSAVRQIKEAAPHIGIQILEVLASNDSEVTAFLQSFPSDVDAIFLVPGTTVNSRMTDLAAVATNRKLPLSGPSTAQVEEGALMTYGFVHHEAGAQAARIADQILRGTNPGEIPVEIAEFFLAINLEVAEAIGLNISEDMLLRADIVIR